ncbi:MAG: SH3-like domain-containing protein [Bacteroidia bacterium]|nr:SH3-like domain-containing protein [Bacteroidia bacterium]
MKFNIYKYAFFLGIIALLTACQSNSTKKVENLASNAHQIVAEEVIQTSRYTYVLVSEDDRGYWIAIPKADIQEEGTYFWSMGSEMNNFKSNELDRSFPNIFFVQDFTDQPILQGDDISASSSMGSKQPIQEQSGIDIPKAEGGITIAELFANRSSYEGKTVKINGRVVKFLPEIMSRNWVHIQDGTKDGDNFDLTITTMEFIPVGEVVTIEGVVAVNKDFGAGYLYDVILEDAVVK